MGARLIPYPQGLAIALAAEPMQRAMHHKMEVARIYAEAIAPVRTGRYAGFTEAATPEPTTAPTRDTNAGPGGFVIVSGVRNGVAYSRLINVTPYARYLEFGTRYMRRRRILGRAMDALK
jgi:hypothetical protein